MPLTYDRNQHTLIFLHIQKTAGSTLARIIDRQYPARRLYLLERGSDDEINQFRALPESQRAQVQMLRGITYYGIHKAFPQESRYFTLLRNPVDRIVSNFMYSQRRGEKRGKGDYTTRKRSIEQWLERWPSQFDLQLRTILGGNSRQETLSQPMPADALERAKAILHAHFSLVGLTERFDESLVLMGQRFGWSKLYYASKLVSPQAQRERITPEQRAWIAGQCTLETEFYEWAKAEFDAVIKAQPPGFQTDLEKLKQASARHSRLYNSTARLRSSAPYIWFRKTLWPGWQPWGSQEDD